MTDLLVVGGGPAGLATALAAHRAGLSVEVLDRRPGVVDKACGEGLMPGGLARLQALGIDPDGHALTGIDYVTPAGRRARASFSAPGRGVRRTVLHAAMREAVLSAGIPLRHRRLDPVRELDVRADHVRLDGVSHRWVVGADGLHSRVRELVAVGRARVVTRPPLAARPRRYGLRAHLRVAPWTSQVEVHFGQGVEAYLTPVAADQLGVALLSSRRAPFADQLTRLGDLGRWFAAQPATQWGPVAGAGPLWQTVSRRVDGPVLLVGDAAGYVDALTGEGVSLALVQATALVECLVTDRPGDWERRWTRLTAAHRIATGGLVAAVSTAPTRAALLGAATTWPAAFQRVVGALAEA
ncbi:NAD(P)/FAD-dependent oxidoreductase [Kytococcus sedentarius]|uniref:NAD(P)/FAD-dependent oxidoreductase n=1 Tax=Kytococcus sedentarius TaxID=1276 RepID=UPI0035BC5198